MESYNIYKILIDIRSSVDLLFLIIMHTLKVKFNNITKKELPLVGFNSSTMYAIGTVVLLVMVIGSIVLKKKL